MQEANIGSRGRLDVALSQGVAREMEELVSTRRLLFYRIACRLLGNTADAEDAVQDALFSAFKHLDQFRGQSQMSTWLTAIVSNCALMQLRKRPPQIQMSLDEPVGEGEAYSVLERLMDRRPNPEDDCRHSELKARVTHLVTQLSPPLRKAFQLRELDGLTTSEAAHVLGVPDGTVKAQLARARTKLRKMLRAAEHGAPGSRAASSRLARNQVQTR